MESIPYWNKSCAAHGLKIYRYRGQFGFVMIGAANDSDALSEALRSVEGEVSLDRLEFWNGKEFEAVNKRRT